MAQGLRWWVGLALGVLGFATAAAQVPAETSSRVTAVVSNRPGEPGRAGLGDELTLTVAGFERLLAGVSGRCEALLLFLDGRALEGLAPDACVPGEPGAPGQVRFHLVRNDADDADWHALLGRPQGLERKIRVSLGTADRLVLPTDVHTFTLVVLPRAGLYAIALLLGPMWAALWWLGRRTNLLRDTAATPGPGERRPFSLARVQMAFWFALVISAVLFLYLVTGELDTLSPSVLAILGLGSGTALGAAAIDSSKAADLAAGRAEMTVEEGAALKGGSRGFLRDILSSATGVTLHRFQNVVLTLVLGFIFVAAVFRTLMMPDFSANLLGLMGISSGTYLGFKLPERYPNDPAASSGT